MHRLTIAAAVVVLALAVAATPAFATNGYFSHGYGTHYKGMAGAGAALSLNSMAPATNPAALAFLGPRWDVGIGLFNPNRSYNVDGQPSGFPGTFGLTPGRVESDSRYFPIPHLGANFQAGENGAFGVALYGNGGMNTTWPTETFYAGRPTGVDLSQMFAAPTYAVRLAEEHALGVTAIAAIQWFEARGVGSFAPFSSDPANLSDNDSSYSFGGGFRLGYQGSLSPYFSIGAAYQTKIWMSEFDEYSGLFAEQGDFDIPSNWVVGIAIKPTENLDVAVDVQQVLYSQVNSVSNPLLPALGACGMGDTSVCLGTAGGSGFGWEDMTTIKGGLQLRTGEGWSWRVGYSYGEQPVPNTEMLFNILAPGVIEQHITAGFSKAFGTQEISLAIMRGLSKMISGANTLEAPGQQTIDLEMDQWEFEISWSFGINR
jgi:long-chain fatty acid transport protein